jgi:hypothetical protein
MTLQPGEASNRSTIIIQNNRSKRSFNSRRLLKKLAQGACSRNFCSKACSKISSGKVLQKIG